MTWGRRSRVCLGLAMLVLIGVAAWSLVNVGSNRSNGIVRVALSRSGDLVAGLDRQRHVRIWRISTGRQEALFKSPGQKATMAFRGEDCLVATVERGKVNLWDAGRGVDSGKLSSDHSDPELSADGTRLVTQIVVKGTPALASWDTTTLALIAKLADPPASAELSANGQTLAVQKRGSISLLDLATGQLEDVLGISDARIAVASPDRKAFAVERETPQGRMIELWRLGATNAVLSTQTSGDPLWILANRDRAARLVFSPDGTALAAGSDTVRVWRVADGTLLRTELPVGERIESLAFSGDGSVLAVTSGDGTVRVSNQSGSRELARFSSDRSTVFWGWLLAAWGVWCPLAVMARERVAAPRTGGSRWLVTIVIGLWVGIVGIGTYLATMRDSVDAGVVIAHAAALAISSAVVTWASWTAGQRQFLRLAGALGLMAVVCTCLVEFAPQSQALLAWKLKLVLPLLVGSLIGLLVSIPLGFAAGTAAWGMSWGRWGALGVLSMAVLMVAATARSSPATLAADMNLHAWLIGLLGLANVDAGQLNAAVFEGSEAAVRGAVCGLVLGGVAVYRRLRRPGNASTQPAG